jgi:hypothetical protein
MRHREMYNGERLALGISGVQRMKQFDPALLSGLRTYLCEKPKTLELLQAFIEDTLKSTFGPNPGPRWEDDPSYHLCQMALTAFYPNGVEIIYSYAESPIEKIFLNSVLLSFVKL